MSFSSWHQKNAYLHFLRLVGQLPLNFSSPTLVAPHWLFRLYGIFLTVFFISCYVLLANPKMGSKVDIFYYVFSFSLALNFITVVSIFLMPSLRADVLSDILNGFIQIDLTFHQMNFKKITKYHQTFCWIILFGFSGFFSYPCILESVTPSWSAGDPNSYWYYQSFNIFQLILLSTLTCFALLVRLRFKNINNQLKDLDVSDVSEAPFYTNSRRYLNVDLSAALFKKKQKFSSLEKLQCLQHAYLTLSESADKLCSFVSAPILSILLSTFIELLTTLFQLLMNITKSSDSTPEGANLEMLMAISKYLVVHILRIFSIILSFTFLNSEMASTINLLYFLQLRCKNNHLNMQLLHFSQMLMHKTKVFSPWGFFPLDLSLFLGMVGATTTYLVIMLQFNTK